jgi:hypothetical protein
MGAEVEGRRDGIGLQSYVFPVCERSCARLVTDAQEWGAQCGGGEDVVLGGVVPADDAGGEGEAPDLDADFGGEVGEVGEVHCRGVCGWISLVMEDIMEVAMEGNYLGDEDV